MNPRPATEWRYCQMEGSFASYAFALCYDKDPDGFERLRIRVKNHLGIEAFDTGDWHYKGKAPDFSFSKEERRERTRDGDSPANFGLAINRAQRRMRQLARQQSVARSPSLGTRGITLNFSENELKELDSYVAATDSQATRSLDFMMKMAAYVSEVMIRNQGSIWSYRAQQIPALGDIPVLRVNGTYISPLVQGAEGAP